MHYRRIRLTGAAGEADTQYGKRMGQIPCGVDGCDRKYFAKGLCSMHYNRKRLTGDAGEAAPRRGIRPTGEWYVNSDGYVQRSFHGKTELQHRVVMSEHLGRELFPDENAHHKNGDRSDNRISNLELWSTWQPAGQRVEDKIAWARELLARYNE
jgi:hypothetical protein